MQNIIGENIKSIRKEKKITQKELAEKCILATITIRQYENGKREPKYETLSKIANALNVSILDLTLSKSKEPKYITLNNIQIDIKNDTADYEATFKRLVDYLEILNKMGKEKAIEQVELLTKIPEYKKDPENQDQE